MSDDYDEDESDTLDDDLGDHDESDDTEHEMFFDRYDVLRAIREEPNQKTKQRMLREYESKYGDVGGIVKRWIGIDGY